MEQTTLKQPAQSSLGDKGYVLIIGGTQWQLGTHPTCATNAGALAHWHEQLHSLDEDIRSCQMRIGNLNNVLAGLAPDRAAQLGPLERELEFLKRMRPKMEATVVMLEGRQLDPVS